MRMPRNCSVLYAVGVLLTLLTTLIPINVARAESAVKAQYNVVLVVDASGSMLNADPKQFRNDVITHIITMLTDKGNELGVVVFTDHVVFQKNIAPAGSVEDKMQVIQQIENIHADGDTNIGESLIAAMDMIDAEGDERLPSVILLLTDGKTDLPYATEEVKASYVKQSEAVQRACDKNVKIYPICLNANENDDIVDMMDMAERTQGVIIEIQDKSDISEAYSKLYNLMYGSITHYIENSKFPQSGKLNTVFTVPKINVKEMDIVLYGKRITYTLIDPDGMVIYPITIEKKEYKALKITDVKAGEWRIQTEGIPEDSVNIKIAFKCDLKTHLKICSNKEEFNPVEEIKMKATFSCENEQEEQGGRYKGFQAELIVYDAQNNKVLYIIPMDKDKRGFHLNKAFEEGKYKFGVHIIGKYVEQYAISKRIIRVSKKVPTKHELKNEPPMPKQNAMVFWTASLSPFIKPSLELTLNKLVTDADDREFRYQIVPEYLKCDNLVLARNTLQVFGLRHLKNELRINVLDRKDAKCEINITVISINYILVIILVELIYNILWYLRDNTKSSKGTITIEPDGNEYYQDKLGVEDKRWIGRLYLKDCKLGPFEKNFKRVYIKATGKNYVLVISDKPMTVSNGKEGKTYKRVKLSSETIEVNIDDKSIHLTYNSDVGINILNNEKKERDDAKMQKKLGM